MIVGALTTLGLVIAVGAVAWVFGGRDARAFVRDMAMLFAVGALGVAVALGVLALMDCLR